MSWADFLPLAVAAGIYIAGCAVLPFLPPLHKPEDLDFGPSPEDLWEETARKGVHAVDPGAGS